ncbi:MAG: TRAP transporter substrate-binding protein DctP [Acetobacteraceae bacterium]|nr:TRAP transporter substrate-binding protein DctP [Acetobacteraceae bacterium]
MAQLTRRALLIASGVALAPYIRRARADAPLQLRCSLDTAPAHGRNVSVADFLKKFEAASDGAVKTELFSSGQLFPDLDVGKALIQGQVEMACPGSWTISGIVPNAELFQLPALYGRNLSAVHRVVDGAAGQIVVGDVKQRLRSQVLGKWLTLGYENLYSTSHPLNSVADVKGLKVRSPGGAGNSSRIRFLGGIPNTTAWPAVPLALSQGTFDALISTDESLVSAKLYEAGVRYSLADREFVGEYIPMVSLTFWNKLPPELQKKMGDIWEENIGTYRGNMQKRQEDARQILIEHGVKIVDPPEPEIADLRSRMMAHQDEVAKELKVSPEIVRLVIADASAAD